MSVRMSILAMVAQRPSYGYLLRAEFDRRAGTGRALNVGQVYKTLDALERDGLVTRSSQTDADGHVFYEATKAGTAEVEQWLTTAQPATTPTRSDLAIKVAVACTLPGVDIDRMLRAQRHAALANLQRLTRETSGADGAGASRTTAAAGGARPTQPASAHPDHAIAGEQLARQLVVDAALFEAEGELRWLDHVEQRIRNARSAGASLEVPFDVDPPRRGRPPRSAREDTA